MAEQKSDDAAEELQPPSEPEPFDLGPRPAAVRLAVHNRPTPQAFPAARVPVTLEDVIREVRATRKLLDEHIAVHGDELTRVNRRLDAIMELLKDALSR